MTIQVLPELIAITAVNRYDDVVHCPHCGAKGHVIYWYETADHQTGGAMGGCIKKFKMHRFASELFRIAQKEDEYRDRSWGLPSWDKEIKAAIYDFRAGLATEAHVDWVIKVQRQKATDYRRKRYR